MIIATNEWLVTEDLLLNCLVKKHGHLGWEKVASCFVRKSAEQCQARWYHCFDPSIIKTREEAEKAALLCHLAELSDAVTLLKEDKAAVVAQLAERLANGKKKG
ncbi:unnamed protein product [Linum tenue]|uniref:Uncharacterized protein n=1 Tax=Linum tenue TaxID=586396 RepID=A0AAV0Q1K6_9ROSI|nr:unnamed protein product [Linum tenue]